MDTKRRSNSSRRVITLILGFLICMPVVAHSFTKDDCYLLPDEGNCENRLSLRVKYYFDADNDDCTEFIYFGCGGNGNRFDSFEECEHSCLYGYGL